jgi:thymidylate synthase (FAD)
MRAILIAHSIIANDIPGYIDHDDDTVTSSDDLAEQAGRLCYESWNRPNPATATSEGYLDNILNQKHYSVFGHASVTIYLDGVTRNLTHEFIRHSHFRYSEVSQRYCDVGQFAFVEHPGLNTISNDTRKMLMAAVAAGRTAYEAIMQDLANQGVERKKARQAARHALVSGTETKILATSNLQGWRDMLWKRLAPSADEEFRQVAYAILTILKEVAPNSFQDFLPDPSA